MKRRNLRVGSIQKYAGCKHVFKGDGRWYMGRELNTQELAEFREHVNAEFAARTGGAPRLQPVKFDEHAAGARSDVAGRALKALAKTPTESMSNIVGTSVFSTTKDIDRNAVVGEGAAAIVKRTTSRKERASAVSRKAMA